MADPRPESSSSLSPWANPSCDWMAVTLFICWEEEEGVLGASVVSVVSCVEGDMGGRGRGGLTRAGESGGAADVEVGISVDDPALGGILSPEIDGY
jgi:hypothetical protein